MYGLVGLTGQEVWAQKYAKAIAKKYPNANIYITGASLGGYLAQFAGAELLNDKNYRDNVVEIAYFNGIGTSFWYNIKDKTKNIPVIGKKISNMLKDVNIQKAQENTYNTLKKYHDNKEVKVTSYEVDGDIICNLGRQPGDRKIYQAHSNNITRYADSQDIGTRAKLSIKVFNVFLNKNLDQYLEKYRAKSGIDYFLATHMMGNFFGALPYADGTVPANIESVKFTSVPDKIKKKKTDNIYLTVTTTKQLTDKTLAKSDFSISNSSKIEIVSVSKPTETKSSGKYAYKYTIKIKGKAITGNATLTLKSGALQTKNGSTIVKNYRLVSSEIKTRL